MVSFLFTYFCFRKLCMVFERLNVYLCHFCICTGFHCWNQTKEMVQTALGSQVSSQYRSAFKCTSNAQTQEGPKVRRMLFMQVVSARLCLILQICNLCRERPLLSRSSHSLFKNLVTASRQGRWSPEISIGLLLSHSCICSIVSPKICICMSNIYRYVMIYRG